MAAQGEYTERMSLEVPRASSVAIWNVHGPMRGVRKLNQANYLHKTASFFHSVAVFLAFALFRNQAPQWLGQ